MVLPFVRRVLGPIAFIENIGNVQEGVGAFIAGPEPDNAFGAAVQRQYRKACDSWSNGPDWVTGLTPQGRAAFSNFCGPYLADNGSGDPQVESEPPPFEGGQCPVAYNIRVQDPIGPTIYFEQTRLGPIGEFSLVFLGGSFIYQVAVPTGEGLIQAPVGGVQIFPAAQERLVQLVTRADGLPDNCGNLPGPPPVIVPNPNPRPNPTYEPGEEPGPNPDPTGPPIIPMPEICSDLFGCVKIPDLTLPDLFGSGDRGEFPPTGPGSPGSPEDVDSGEDAEGEAPAGKVLIGVKVEVLERPLYAREAQFIPNPPLIGACYVYLGWPNQVALQPQGTYLLSGDFFVAPLNATKWVVRATLGYRLRVTPYYENLEPLEV